MSNITDSSDPKNGSTETAGSSLLTASAAKAAPPADDVALSEHHEPQFSRALLVALLRFRDGDFSARMPSDLTGIDGKIADAFNEIVAVSERRADETARVSRAVGKEGKLKQRMTRARRRRRLGRRSRRASTR